MGAVGVDVESRSSEAAPAVSAPTPPYPQQGGYDPRYDQRGHHNPRYRHHKRKKSWLEDIFD